MNKLRKQRLQVVLLIIVAGALASGLIIYMLGQNVNYFYTPLRSLEAKPLRECFCVLAGWW